MLKIQKSHTHVWAPFRLRLLTNSFDARTCICGAVDYLVITEGQPPRWVHAIHIQFSQPHEAEHDWFGKIADGEGKAS